MTHEDEKQLRLLSHLHYLGAALFVLLIGVLAVGMNVATARSLRDRKNHTLCLLRSGLNCLHPPLLGVSTIVVLCRPAVSAAIRSRAVPPGGPGPFAPSAPPPAPNTGSLGASG